jgi:hypothetical protein
VSARVFALLGCDGVESRFTDAGLRGFLAAFRGTEVEAAVLALRKGEMFTRSETEGAWTIRRIR